MKLSIKSLLGYSIAAQDGDIGILEEFYLDDETLTIRYIVVGTGHWWLGKKVLIPTDLLDPADWALKSFPVNLTRDQIKNSPGIDTEKPVSRQQESELYKHYGNAIYWTPHVFSKSIWGLNGILPATTERVSGKDIESDERRNSELHLRSTRTLSGYRVQGTDGKIGKVEDLIIEDKMWVLHQFVIDTSVWFPGKRLLMSSKCIKEISWDDSIIFVDMSGNDVERA